MKQNNIQTNFKKIKKKKLALNYKSKPNNFYLIRKTNKSKS